MTRVISIADLKDQKAFSTSGEPLFEEPITKSIPQITFSPEITIQQPEIHVPPTIVYVDAPDLKPVAEAMKGMKDAVLAGISSMEIPAPAINIETTPPTINIETIPPDMTPIANAMHAIAGVFQEISNKADHSEAIKDLLQQIADKPQVSSWSFKLRRDSNGDVEDVDIIPNRDKTQTQVTP